MREPQEGEITEDSPQKKTNTDIRDSQKIATLPNDLRDIANQMLEEKFGLSAQGEIVNPKDVVIDPKEEGDAEESRMETIDAASLFNEYPTMPDDPTEMFSKRMMTLSSEDFRKASQALRTRDFTLRDGVTVEFWARYWHKNPERLHGYRVINLCTVGAHTGSKYAYGIDPYRIMAMSFEETVQLVDCAIEDMQRRALEPMIILHPRERE